MFEIVSDAGEPVIRPVAGTQSVDDVNGLFLTTRSATTFWAMQNAILRSELTQVDNAVKNNIASHSLQGGKLRTVFPAYHSFAQNCTAGNTEISMNIVNLQLVYVRCPSHSVTVRSMMPVGVNFSLCCKKGVLLHAPGGAAFASELKRNAASNLQEGGHQDTIRRVRRCI